MSWQQESVTEKIRLVCKQWKKRVWIVGSCRVFVITMTAFLVALAFDAFFELDSVVRIVLLVVILALFGFSAFRLLIRPLLELPGQGQIARYIEERHPHLEDRLVTAVEVGDKSALGSSKAMIEKLIEDTRLHLRPLNLRKDVQSRGAFGWGAGAAALAICLGMLLFFNFNDFNLTSSRILTPWQFPTLKPKPELSVTPGTVRVPKESAQPIRAELNGFESQDVFLYYSTSDTSWTKVEMDGTVQGNVYLFNFFDLQQETKYYVKADEKLSEVYTFSVYEAPRIKRVDLTYKYPAYTGLGTKKEIDSGDVWAPEGTVVTIRAVADKQLAQAAVILGESRELRTTILQDTIATATLTVDKDGYYKIAVTDADDLTNAPAPEYFIHALPDQEPLLTLEWPARDIKASMLEEVPVRAQVEDDFGSPELSVRYVVNGGTEEQVVKLQLAEVGPESARLGRKKFRATHLFYLENMGVEPGDFIEYYVEASDRGQAEASPVTSDVYFVEIRSFKMEFQRPLSQQQGGSGGAMGGRLSQTQKEIMVATWKTAKRAKTLSPENLANNIEILLESQKNLMEVTQNTLFQLQQRSVFTQDVGQDVKEHYTRAVEAMQDAITHLEKNNLSATQLAQRKSLSALLQAEGQIEQVQIQQAQTGGQGTNTSLDELAQLFEEEMDNLKNKYETLNDAPQQRSDQQVNEALQKVRELARRQQESNRKMRDLSRSGFSEAEKKRQIEELRREQERLRRETQELTRQMDQNQRQSGNLSREVQDNLRQASSEMNNASHNLRNDNAELAAAKGTRALNRLNQLENMLRENQKESLRRELNELQQDFQELTDAQRNLAEEVRDLSGDSGKTTEKLQQARNEQQKLRQGFDDIERQTESLAQSAAGNKDRVARDMKKLADDLARAGLAESMKNAEKLLEEEKLSSALQAEKDIVSKLERTGNQLTELRTALAETEEEKLDLALNQTRRLRQQIESIDRQNRQVQGESQQAGGESSAQQGGGTPRQAGPGEGGQNSETLDPADLDWMNEQLARSVQDLETLQRGLRADTSLAAQAGALTDQIDNLLRTFTGGAPERLSQIQQHVLVPLKGLEAELAQRLELIKNREKLFLAREEKVPPGYEALVEKYYEALSKTK